MKKMEKKKLKLSKKTGKFKHVGYKDTMKSSDNFEGQICLVKKKYHRSNEDRENDHGHKS